MMIDISETIQIKSDQLNADDLIGNPTTITVTDVKVLKSNEQPLVINYEGDNGKPYKPCLSMRKVLAGIWGKDASKWIGQSVTLFNDPSVKWAGKEVGGIRISHMTGIDKTKNVSMNQSKHQKTTWVIEPLAVQVKKRAEYPDDKFNEQFESMKKAIESGKSTHEQILTYLQKTADVTDDQIAKLSAVKKLEQKENFFEE